MTFEKNIMPKLYCDQTTMTHCDQTLLWPMAKFTVIVIKRHNDQMFKLNFPNFGQMSVWPNVLAPNLGNEERNVTSSVVDVIVVVVVILFFAVVLMMFFCGPGLPPFVARAHPGGGAGWGRLVRVWIDKGLDQVAVNLGNGWVKFCKPLRTVRNFQVSCQSSKHDMILNYDSSVVGRYWLENICLE